MKEFDDEGMQRLLEDGLKPLDGSPAAGKNDDFIQYQSLFERLKQEPKEGLPYNFASKVKGAVQSRLNRKRDIQFYVTATIGVVLGFAAFYGLLNYVNANAGSQFIIVLDKFKWVIGMAIIVFMTILFLDQKLVKEQVLKQ